MSPARARRNGVALLLAIAAASGAGVAHADVPLELRGRRIVEVAIEGETAGVTSPREVGIPLGAPISRRLLRYAVNRLVRSGRWSDVQLDAVPVAGGVRLVAFLVPRLLVARIEVRGNHVLDDEEVMRAMSISEGGELRREAGAELAESAEQIYADHGYLDARARIGLIDTDDPFKKVLVVHIEEGAPARIVGFRFRGEVPPPESGARDAMEIDVGDVLDRGAVESSVQAAQAAMRERGYLEARLGDPRTVRTPRGIVLAMDASVGPRYEIVIRGHQPLVRSDVEEVLELGREPLTHGALTAMRERVLELFRRHGFHDVAVSIERVSRTREQAGKHGARAALLVTIAPRRQLAVVGIAFPGARHFDTELLRDQVYSYLEEELPGSSITFPVDSEVADTLGFGDTIDMNGRARTVGPPLVLAPRSIFHEATYEKALDHIRELYQAAGFLGVRVGPARMQHIDVRRIAVEVPIIEGPRTMLHGVILRGNRVVGARELLTAAGLSQGDPFGYVALEQARLRMLELYRERGHIYARIEPSVRFSRDRTRAQVIVQVVESFPVRVSAIVVHGTTRTSPALVRARVRLRPGGLFRPSLVRESQDRLLEVGVFSSVTIAPEHADLPARVKRVIVTVAERPSNHVDVWGGLNSGEGAHVGAEYGYRKLFAYAVDATLRGQIAYQFFFFEREVEERFERLSLGDRLERTVTLTFSIPHIPYLLPFRASIDLSHVRDNERDFGLDRNAIGSTLTYQPLKRLTFSVTPELENNNVELFAGEALDEYLNRTSDPRLQRLLRVPEGESSLVATRALSSLDLRDSPFVPTRGMFLSVAGEWARTIRTEQVESSGEAPPTQFFSHFVKLSVTATGYVPVIEGVVLATQIRFGRVFHLDDASQTYPNRRFFLGGVDTMRGYLQDGLVPQDLADEILARGDLNPNIVVRGGDAFVLLRSELRFPIFGELQGGAFADVGNLWTDAAHIEPFNLRPTAGLGLRLATPVGPLALDYGIIVLQRKALNEGFGAFHFSIGLF